MKQDRSLFVSSNDVWAALGQGLLSLASTIESLGATADSGTSLAFLPGSDDMHIRVLFEANDQHGYFMECVTLAELLAANDPAEAVREEMERIRDNVIETVRRAQERPERH